MAAKNFDLIVIGAVVRSFPPDAPRQRIWSVS